MTSGFLWICGFKFGGKWWFTGAPFHGVAPYFERNPAGLIHVFGKRQWRECLQAAQHDKGRCCWSFHDPVPTKQTCTEAWSKKGQRCSCVWKKGDTPFHQGEQQFHLDPLGSTWIIHWLSLWVSIETNGLIIILSTQKLIILVEDMMINPLTYPPWPAGQPQGRQFPSTRSLIEGCARGPRRYTRLVPWYLRLNLIISLPLFLNW